MKLVSTILFILIGWFIVGYSLSHTNNLRIYAEVPRLVHHIPGMAFAVVKADTILEMSALGKRKIGNSASIELHDRFHIGSNTKSMTAFMAAHLVENGLIDWSTRFLDVFPDWGAQINSSYQQLTLGELLSHRGRVPKFWTKEALDSIAIDPGSKSAEREAFVKYVLRMPPIMADTFGYEYSNAGYTIAAQMLEKVCGATWEELMLDVFNKDLDLDIGFSWPHLMDTEQPWGHQFRDGKLHAGVSDDDFKLNWLEPGGDVCISLQNYCRFIQMNLKGLAGEDNYLKASTYDLLHTDSVGPVYALGWSDYIQNGRRYSYHAGSAGTFLATTTIDKTASIAYVMMSNTDSPAARDLMIVLRKKMESKYAEWN